MDKFMHFVEDKMSPIADKLGEQRHLSAMQKGFMTVLPLIFVGAVFMVIKIRRNLVYFFWVA